MTEHDTLKVDQHKIENDISNLELSPLLNTKQQSLSGKNVSVS